MAFLNKFSKIHQQNLMSKSKSGEEAGNARVLTSQAKSPDSQLEDEYGLAKSKPEIDLSIH